MVVRVTGSLTCEKCKETLPIGWSTTTFHHDMSPACHFPITYRPRMRHMCYPLLFFSHKRDIPVAKDQDGFVVTHPTNPNGRLLVVVVNREW